MSIMLYVLSPYLKICGGNPSKVFIQTNSDYEYPQRNKSVHFGGFENEFAATRNVFI